MARRSKSIFEDVANAPWYVGVIMAAASYIGLKLILPAISTQNPFINGIFKAMPSVAPVIAILFLLCAIRSAYNSYRKGKLFARQTSIDSVRLIDWRQFEELVGESYRRKGYRVTETGGGGTDGGVDLVLNKDGEKILVQCKHWRTGQVGVKIVRELYGVVAAQGATGGIVISSGRFTQEARDFASGKQIELIDGSGLVRMMSEVKNTQKPEGKPVIDDSVNNNTCPLCHSPMVLRTAAKGPHAGSKFWGCSTFPKCKGIRPYND